MKTLADRGLFQAVLPPLERPTTYDLAQFGFQAGNEEDRYARAASVAPTLFAALISASSMWTANAATVTPSPDTPDGRVHLTPANLFHKLHRALEARQTTRILRAVFRSSQHFIVHDPLPGGLTMSDEGAANHTRFCPQYGAPGLHFFVYGRSALHQDVQEPCRFPARQTLEAGEAIARRHGLPEERVIHWQQSPEAIDAGVFHNDVIAVGDRDCLLVHEQAYWRQADALTQLRTAYRRLHSSELRVFTVPASRVSLSDAVQTYLFNSQLLEDGLGGSLLLAPSECEEHTGVREFLRELLEDPDCPVTSVLFQNLRESMCNGGGPACLRLRVVLSLEERKALAEGDGLQPRIFLDDDLYRDLKTWVEKHYRDEMRPIDLTDPALWRDTRRALDELSGLLQLGAIYDFQH